MFTSVELLYSNSFPRVFVLGSNVVQFSRSAAEVSLSQDLYCTTFLMRCQYISQIFFRYLSSFLASRPSLRDSLFILPYTSPTVKQFSHFFSFLSPSFSIHFVYFSFNYTILPNFGPFFSQPQKTRTAESRPFSAPATPAAALLAHLPSRESLQTTALFPP